jgi:hypothetical protein
MIFRVLMLDNEAHILAESPNESACVNIFIGKMARGEFQNFGIQPYEQAFAMQLRNNLGIAIEHNGRQFALLQMAQ